MRLNADFSQTAVVVPDPEAWVCSPESGVDRLMLDRIGDEVARATSIVRYAPGSRFPRHEHAKGEEFLVLDGVFSDESGDYGRGSYVRNPPGSGHAPYSQDGCRIFVKLRQFDPQDGRQFAIDTTNRDAWQPCDDGCSTRLSLHEFGEERVAILRTPQSRLLPIHADDGGVEVLVVEGSVRHAEQRLPDESWLRFPPGENFELFAESDVTVWTKSGHLPPAD